MQNTILNFYPAAAENGMDRCFASLSHSNIRIILEKNVVASAALITRFHSFGIGGSPVFAGTPFSKMIHDGE
jgi:hypothetical protein